MEKKTWKALAIVFIILFTLLLVFNLWAINYNLKVEANTNECYYDICDGYADADYSENVCYCYNYDLMGELVIDKTEIIK